MKKTEERSISSALRRYADFLACWDLAEPVCETFPDWAEHSRREWKLLWDFCFRGTDADLEVPLWASVSREEHVLCNQTTLEVIRFYHRFGYAPEWMEGNPPDYLGEQLAFLAYLAGAADRSRPETGERLVTAFSDFLQEYTLMTARAVRQALRDYKGCFWGLTAFLDEMMTFLADPELGSRLLMEADPESALPLREAIPDEAAHMVNTGGINNCGGICVIRPRVQENCILQIETDCDPSHLPQIRACVRGRGYRKTFLHSGRLRYPMRRLGERGSGKFERISWEEAVEEIAENWIRIRDRYGPGSRYVIYGTGVTGIMRPGKLLKRLLALDGGYLDYFNSYSSACVSYVTPYLYGTGEASSSAMDLLDTSYLILWADNTAESIFGPERNYYLSILKKKGVPIVAIDPRLSQTGVAYADEWFAIRPSTDGALADAMAYVIWSEGLQDQAFMDRYCLGFDEDHMPEGIPAGESYHSYLFGLRDGVVRTPEWAAGITGIEADRIRRLARAYASAKPACILAGLGAQRTARGEQAARSIMALCCLTGNVGKAGGGTAGNGSSMTEHEKIALFNDQVKNPYPGRIPVFLWTRAVEHGTEMTPAGDRLKGVDHLDSSVKMIFSMASNTLVNQHGDIHDTIRILKDTGLCELIVAADIFMNASTRYADLVLPATSVFEGENINNPWAGSNYLIKHNPVIRPIFGCRFEWEWLKELADRLGYYEAFIDGMPESGSWLKKNYETLRAREPELPDYETFSKAGGWQYRKPVHTIAFEQEIRDPEHHPFPTPSGKIEIFSKALYEMHEKEIPAIPGYLPSPEGWESPLRAVYPLQLIGWHTRRRCHSIHDNNEWQEEIERPGVWIHPEDAAARGIRDGELTEVFNDRGCTRIPAIVTRRIRQGVVAISQGGWYTPDPNGVDTRGSINVLTSSEPTPLAKGNGQHTSLVQVRKAEGRKLKNQKPENQKPDIVL